MEIHDLGFSTVSGNNVNLNDSALSGDATTFAIYFMPEMGCNLHAERRRRFSVS